MVDAGLPPVGAPPTEDPKPDAGAGGPPAPGKATPAPEPAVAACPDVPARLCNENEKEWIRRADALARQMLEKVRRILQEEPLRKELDEHFRNFFYATISRKGEKDMPLANVPVIRNSYSRLITAFYSGDHGWWCANCSDPNEYGKTPYWGPEGIRFFFLIRLCMNNLIKYPLVGTSATMIHEMCHLKLGFTDAFYCTGNPSEVWGCPGDGWDSEAALKNADSHSGFALAVWKLKE